MTSKLTLRAALRVRVDQWHLPDRRWITDRALDDAIGAATPRSLFRVLAHHSPISAHDIDTISRAIMLDHEGFDDDSDPFWVVHDSSGRTESDVTWGVAYAIGRILTLAENRLLDQDAHRFPKLAAMRATTDPDVGMTGRDNPTLDELIELRLPGIRPRTRIAAFTRARPEALEHDATGFTRLDDASLRRLRESLDRFPAALRCRAIADELGNPASDADFDTALRARLLRIVDDAVEIARAIQRDRRDHPVLDLSGLPATPSYHEGRPIPAARYVAAHGEAQGVLSVASYDPATGMAMTNEIWTYPGGGRGGEWREQHVEDFSEGWVRDPAALS